MAFSPAYVLENLSQNQTVENSGLTIWVWLLLQPKVSNRDGLIQSIKQFMVLLTQEESHTDDYYASRWSCRCVQDEKCLDVPEYKAKG